MERQAELATSRNGKIRAAIKPTVDKFALWINQKTSISADEMTLLGNLLVGGAAIHAGYINRNNDASFQEKSSVLGEIVVASGTDGLDGAIARSTGTESSRGQILDAVSDRAQEAYLGISRMYSSFRRKDKIGVSLALGSTLSNALPSIIKARAESHGIVVPEEGRNPLQLLGTRLGRTATAAIGTSFPETQRYADSLNIAANLNTSASRLWYLYNETDRKLPLPKQLEAHDRFKALALTGIGVALVAGTYYYLHGREEIEDKLHNANKESMQISEEPQVIDYAYDQKIQNQ